MLRSFDWNVLERGEMVSRVFVEERGVNGIGFGGTQGEAFLWS
jgi:hypothetical protein